MHHILRRYAVIALSALGSATLLFSCSDKPEPTQFDYETLLTESSENRTITMMENGRRSYTFVSPLMEGYSMATNPYQEFRRGINMTTYTQDSINLVDANITANYAIYYENQKLWEAKGNVVIIKNNRKDGDTTITSQTEIYTQQLFWNATTKKIYSNVDTKILQADGWHFGVGFDADEDLKNIHFRKYSSEIEFDMSQPTEEELEAENKKREEEASKKGNKGADKRGSDKRDNDKRAKVNNSGNTVAPGKKYDPTKNNGIRPSSAPTNVSPTPNGAKATTPTARKNQLPAENERSAKPPVNKPGNKMQNVDLSTTSNLDIDIRNTNMNNAAKLDKSVKR